MTIQIAIRERIIILCRQQGITVNELQRESGIPYTTFRDIINGTHKSPRVSTIQKVCDGLNITLVDFFVDDLFRDLE